MITRRKILKGIVLISIILMIITSCKSRFQTVFKERVLFDQTVLKDVSDGFLSFTTFSSKLKIEGDFLDSKRPLKGALKIRRDSIIWLSVNLSTGIPISKMIFTTDSFKIQDRIKNILYVGDYNGFNTRFNINVNYYLLESMLLNEFVICQEDDGTSVDRTVIELDNIYDIKCVATKNNETMFNIDYFVNKEIFKIEKVDIDVDSSKYSVAYSEFDEIDGKLFPELMRVLAYRPDNNFVINIEISKVNLDKKQKYSFKVGKNYERVYLNDL